MERTLSQAERKRLKAEAQRLDPVASVGRAGLTQPVIAGIDAALSAHRLIKVRFTEHKEARFEMAERIAAATGAELVTVIGHVAVFFRAPADPAA
jgi:RNA-binding protein